MQTAIAIPVPVEFIAQAIYALEQANIPGYAHTTPYLDKKDLPLDRQAPQPEPEDEPEEKQDMFKSDVKLEHPEVFIAQEDEKPLPLEEWLKNQPEDLQVDFWELVLNHKGIGRRKIHQALLTMSRNGLTNTSYTYGEDAVRSVLTKYRNRYDN